MQLDLFRFPRRPFASSPGSFFSCELPGGGLENRALVALQWADDLVGHLRVVGLVSLWVLRLLMLSHQAKGIFPKS